MPPRSPVVIDVIRHPDGAERPEVQVRIAHLQRVVRPAHVRDAIEAPRVAAALLQLDTEAESPVFMIDCHVVRVQHRRLTRRKSVDRAHDATVGECTDRHAALGDGSHQHVDRDCVAATPPDVMLESRATPSAPALSISSRNSMCDQVRCG